MKNQKLLDHIKKYNEDHEYRCETPADYLETLRECGETIYRGKTSGSQWWDNYFCVTKLDGIEIGFNDADTTGDTSPADKGWHFEISDICEVERHEEVKVSVTYTKGSKQRGVDGMSAKDSRVVDGVVVSYEFLQTVFDYIEQKEVKIDGEWGDIRTAKQMIAEKDMPFIHRVVGELLSTRY